MWGSMIPTFNTHNTCVYAGSGGRQCGDLRSPCPCVYAGSNRRQCGDHRSTETVPTTPAYTQVMAVEDAGILGPHTPAYAREVAVDNAGRVNMTYTAVIARLPWSYRLSTQVSRIRKVHRAAQRYISANRSDGGVVHIYQMQRKKWEDRSMERTWRRYRDYSGDRRIGHWGSSIPTSSTHACVYAGNGRNVRIFDPRIQHICNACVYVGNGR